MLYKGEKSNFIETIKIQEKKFNKPQISDKSHYCRSLLWHNNHWLQSICGKFHHKPIQFGLQSIFVQIYHQQINDMCENQVISKKSFEYLQSLPNWQVFPRKHQDSSKSITLYGWLKLTWPIQTFTEQAGLNSLWSTRLNLIDGNRIRNGTVLNRHGDHTPKCNFNLDIFNK